MILLSSFLVGFSLGLTLRDRSSPRGADAPLLSEAAYLTLLPKPTLIRLVLVRDVQLKILRRKNPPIRTTMSDRAMILFLIQGLPAWKDHICIVSASTIRNWMKRFPKGVWSLRTWTGILLHRVFRRFRKKSSSAPSARSQILAAMRTIVAVDRIRGIDRIHGELMRLGFGVSRSRVAIYLRRYFPDYRRPPRNGVTPAQLLTSIKNAWAIDFFVLLTFIGKPLYVFFVIDQESRKIMHAAVAFHPCGMWVIDRVKRALATHPAPKYLISDNDPVFRYSLGRYLKAVGVEHRRTTYRSPWQNGIAERWIQTARREVFDRVPIFSSRQVEKLLHDYTAYYNNHRTHLALAGDTPAGRPITPRDTVRNLSRIR